MRGGTEPRRKRANEGEPARLRLALARSPGREAPTACSPDPRLRLAARDAEALERILVIDDRVPHHDRGSGDPRMARILAELADLWPRRGSRSSPQIRGMPSGMRLRSSSSGSRWPVPTSASTAGSRRRRSTTRSSLVSRASNIERFEHFSANAAAGAANLRHRGPRLPPVRAGGRRAAQQLRELESRGSPVQTSCCASPRRRPRSPRAIEAPVFVLPT